MIDELALRRPSFEEGEHIRLANGQEWTLPNHPPYNDDLEHQDVLRGIIEAEDVPERLRAELALTILLLSRNYDLLPEEYHSILEFAPGDPQLGELQDTVHQLAREQIRTLRRLPNPDKAPTRLPGSHCRLFGLLRPRKRAESRVSSPLKGIRMGSGGHRGA
jgi:hypothetical protein